MLEQLSSGQYWDSPSMCSKPQFQLWTIEGWEDIPAFDLALLPWPGLAWIAVTVAP